MRANYDTIAKYYDFFSRIVFGRSIRKSQLYLLQHIRPGTTILIIGGGTGWILEDITALHASGLRITYVEQSVSMMERSQKRNIGSNKVKFECKPIQDCTLIGRYDVVLVPFLFDNYAVASIELIIQTIEPHLTGTGVWLYADFTLHNCRIWTKLLVKLMYLIFKPICNLEVRTLPDISFCFDRNHYSAIHEASFYSGFISSIVYQKSLPICDHNNTLINI
ncbi:class I SAM-dependent methyltransferase [Anditalea andensis]|uniref:Methyltransferase domain-containing protein n=1 Tax=Anditalea andensis TaxID=1048983 RepID=A0A074LJ03_9BACT|nr:class I SAM-dependent methyltransferase [Anditalea andensis]KEO73787.1 hypothetical protein EL17_09765 [Anditalea andensis]